MTRRIFIVLALIAIVPIWSVHYLPTGDGPCHLYNAWILHDLATGKATEPIASWYRIDWRPHPNWIGHAALALLLFVVPPLVAEKILVTAIVLTFLAGAWILTGAVDERCRVYAFIAFPFAFNMLLQAGFYNFVTSVGLFMIVLGLWWRRRDDPSWRTIAIVALLLILTYFSHPMGVALAIGSIGVLWLVTLRGRPFKMHVRHLAAFAPSIALLGWFAYSRGASGTPNEKTARELFTFLERSQILFSFDFYQLQAGRGIAIALLVLIVASAIAQRFPKRLREADGFFLLFLIFLGLYFFAPGAVAGGQLVTERMALFVTLLVLPWLSPELPLGVRRAVAIVFAVLALLNTGYLVKRYRRFDRVIADYLSTTTTIPPNRVVMPLLIDRQSPGAFVSVITHAIDYVAIDKHLIDLDNYEPYTDYFPVTWAPGAHQPDVYAIEATPGEIDFSEYAPFTDVIFAWKLPEDLAEDVDEFYTLVHSESDARVYARRAGIAEQTTILLPLAGTVGEIMTANGARWRIDQTIRNRSGENVRVFVNGRDVDLPPGASVPIRNAHLQPPYELLRVERRVAPLIDGTTLLRRVGTSYAASLPMIRESDLRPSPLVIPGVTLTAPVHLRVWTFDAPRPARYTVKVGPTARPFVTGADGFEMASLEANGGRADVVITAADPKTKLWAFVTSGETPTMFFPK